MLSASRSSVLRLEHARRFPFNLSLYLVANRPSFKDEEAFLEKIKAAVDGGVTCVQFRDHENTLSQTMKTAKRIQSIVPNTPLFINTLHSLALIKAVDAAGIYIENNASYIDIRKYLGEQKIIGLRAKNWQSVLALKPANAIDYLSVKISASKKTCPYKNDYLWGIDGLKKIRQAVPHPIVAIGGINVSNVAPVYEVLTPSDGVAMAGGLMDAVDPKKTARKILYFQQKALRGC